MLRWRTLDLFTFSLSNHRFSLFHVIPSSPINWLSLVMHELRFSASMDVKAHCLPQDQKQSKYAVAEDWLSIYTCYLKLIFKAYIRLQDCTSSTLRLYDRVLCLFSSNTVACMMLRRAQTSGQASFPHWPTPTQISGSHEHEWTMPGPTTGSRPKACA